MDTSPPPPQWLAHAADDGRAIEARQPTQRPRIGSSACKHVVVLYTEAGGGHRSAAETIEAELSGDGRFRVTLVSAYQEIFADLDVFRRFTPYDAERIYNELILAQGHTKLFCLLYYAIAVVGIYAQRRKGTAALQRFFERSKPDLIISVMPLINQAVVQALSAQAGKANRPPFLIWITDWSEMSRHSWFPRGGGYYAVCGTELGCRQLNRGPKRGDGVFRTEGLLIRSPFIGAAPQDHTMTRLDLGVQANKPLVCAMYGGSGSWRMLALAEAVQELRLDIQMVMLCGYHRLLADALRGRSWRFPMRVVGYTSEVHRYLSAADVFVGKPGPASVSEALALGLPMLLDRKMTLPQERPIVPWIEQQQFGLGFNTPAEFADRLRRLLGEGSLAGTAIQLRTPSPNRAAVELPGIIERVLQPNQQ